MIKVRCVPEKSQKNNNNNKQTNKTKTKTKPKCWVPTYPLGHLNVKTKIAFNKKSSSATRLTYTSSNERLRGGTMKLLLAERYATSHLFWGIA